MKKMWDIYHEKVPEFLVEFMNLDIMKRIENVGMNCGCEYTSHPWFQKIKPYSRFTHSVGCALIVWHFTQDKKQSLAALFHDVATPAFSHVIDFLHQDHLNQESTEEKTEEILRKSEELQVLLEKLGIQLNEISNYHKYPVADNDTPMLSSDRLEYTLSNFVNYQIYSMDEVSELYQDLTVDENEMGQPEIMFQTKRLAKKFASGALKLSKLYTADVDRFLMQILSEIIAAAIKRNVLSEHDLYQDERFVVSKLMSDAFVSELWLQFIKLDEVVRRENVGTTGTWRMIQAKKRWINPMVKNEGRVLDFSQYFKSDAEKFLSCSFDVWVGTNHEFKW